MKKRFISPALMACFLSVAAEAKLDAHCANKPGRWKCVSMSNNGRGLGVGQSKVFLLARVRAHLNCVNDASSQGTSLQDARSYTCPIPGRDDCQFFTEAAAKRER